MANKPPPLAAEGSCFFCFQIKDEMFQGRAPSWPCNVCGPEFVKHTMREHMSDCPIICCADCLKNIPVAKKVKIFEQYLRCELKIHQSPNN